MGQIAHLDQNSANSAEGNLVFLCLPHHTEYDSTTSQHKNFTETEIRKLRNKLHAAMRSYGVAMQQRTKWVITLSGSAESEEAAAWSIETHLRSLLNDPTLIVESVKRGSIIANVDSTLSAFMTATLDAKAQSFTETVGRVEVLPRLDDVPDVVIKLYHSLEQDMGDPLAAGAMVQAILLDAHLVNTPDFASRHWAWVESMIEKRIASQYGDAIPENVSVQRLQGCPPLLRVAIRIVALGVAPDEASRILDFDEKTTDVLLLIGYLVLSEGRGGVMVGAI